MAKSSNSEFIDIPALIKQYLSKWYLFVISIVLCTGLAFVYSKVRQPEYVVKANLLISPEKDGSAAAAESVMGGALSSLLGSEGYVEDEIFIVSSHSLYRQVVKDLELNVGIKIKKAPLIHLNPYPNSPINAILPAGMADTLQTGIGFKVSINEQGIANITGKMRRSKVVDVKDVTLPYVADTPIGKITIVTTEHYTPGTDINATISVTGYDAAAEKLDKLVQIEMASRHSNVLSMSLQTPNADYGKAILNQIIQEYNKRGIAERNEQNQLTARFIEERLALLSGELSETEASIQKYKEDKGIIDIEFQAKYQADKKSRIEEELLRAQTQEEITQLTLNFLRDPKNTYALIPTTLDNEGIQRNIEAYNQAIIERMQIANSARGDNATLRQISARIDAMRDNITASVIRALEASHVSVKDLRKEMVEASGQLENIPQQEREFRNILRQQQVKQSLFIFLLQRREETAMMLANNFPKGVVIDRAYTMSDPVGLKKSMILIIGFLFGCILAPIYLYLRKMLSNRIETRKDVERMTDVPIVGEICTDHSGTTLVASADSTSPTAELFRLLRSNLLFVLNDPRDKVVLTTSYSAGEGKTFVSVNLAATLALLGKRVMLIGMDIRNPQLGAALGISPRYGLTQYLATQNITIDQIRTHLDAIPGLDVIVAGPVPPNPAELLISNRVDELIATLRQQYDYIIIDTAPIGQVSDTYSLDRLADASLFVCRINHTSVTNLEVINEIAEQHRLKKVSIVINGTNTYKTYGYGQK